jgi:hypothetical protein
LAGLAVALGETPLWSQIQTNYSISNPGYSYTVNGDPNAAPVPLPPTNDVINVHFLGSVGGNSTYALAQSQVAGITFGTTQLPGWNTITNETPGSPYLSDDAVSYQLRDILGNYTAVQVIYQCDNDYQSNGKGGNPTEALFRGEIKEFNPYRYGATANSAGLPPFIMHLGFTNVPAGSYDVLVGGVENAAPFGCEIFTGQLGYGPAGPGTNGTTVAITHGTNWFGSFSNGLTGTFFNCSQTNFWLEADDFGGVNGSDGLPNPPRTGANSPADTFWQSMDSSAGISAIDIVTNTDNSTYTNYTTNYTYYTNYSFGTYVLLTNLVPIHGGIDIWVNVSNTVPMNCDLLDPENADGQGVSIMELFTSGTFAISTPVAITQQPFPALATPGSTATFTVGTTGLYPTYQWYSNSVAISGATATSYTTPALTLAANGAQYKVVVKNPLNSVTSTAVSLTVEADPLTRVDGLGVSFIGNINATAQSSLSANELAGVVPQTNWNIAAGEAGTVDLQNGTGFETTAQIIYAANDEGVSDAASYTTPNEQLFGGVLMEDNNGSVMTLVFTNLPEAFYDVYVYGNVTGGPSEAAVNIGLTTNYWEEPNLFNDTYTPASSQTPGAYADGNYTKFSSVVPYQGGFSVNVAVQNTESAYAFGVSAVQLRSSSAITVNPTPVAISFPPEATLALPGSNATFTVEASGPFITYQWNSNGVAIAGATASSYTTPALALGANGAQFSVTVSNNVDSVTSFPVDLSVMNDPGSRVDLISVSFLGGGYEFNNTGSQYSITNWFEFPTNVAGFIASSNWNNVTNEAVNNIGISAMLINSNAELTDVQMQFAGYGNANTFNGNGVWGPGQPWSPDQNLFVKAFNDNGTMNLAFTNLPPAFYDVYVYGAVAKGPESVNISIDGVTSYWQEDSGQTVAGTTGGDGANFEGYILGGSTNQANGYVDGDYVVFTSVMPVNGTIAISAIPEGGTAGEVGICGLQLVSSANMAIQEPLITVAAQGANVSLSWPNSLTSYQLQSIGALGGTNWSNVARAPTLSLNGGTYSVNVSAAGSAQFYRLIVPGE